MTQNAKTQKNTNVCFSTKLQKIGIRNICILCHNLQLLKKLRFRPVKDEHTYGKKWPEMVVKQSFLNNFHFETVFSLALEHDLIFGAQRCTANIIQSFAKK